MAVKKRRKEENKNQPSWLTTYGDLVTLLLCFFVMLYAMSNVDQAKFEAVAASFSGGSDPKSIMNSGNRESIMNLLSNGIMQPKSTPPEQEPARQQGQQETPEESKEEPDEPINEKRIREAMKELEKISSDFQIYLKNNNLQDNVQIELTDRYIKINLPEDVLFDSGSAEIKVEALPILEVISSALNQYPDNEVEVEGHADNAPISTIQYKNNWYLSSARATEVGAYLVDYGGINPARIITVGYGEYKPVASNDTEEGRARNRRVEIKIISTYYSNKDQQ